MRFSVLIIFMSSSGVSIRTTFEIDDVLPDASSVFLRFKKNESDYFKFRFLGWTSLRQNYYRYDQHFCIWNCPCAYDAGFSIAPPGGAILVVKAQKFRPLIQRHQVAKKKTSGPTLKNGVYTFLGHIFHFLFSFSPNFGQLEYRR